MADIRQRTVSILPSVERIQEELARANSIDDRLLIVVVGTGCTFPVSGVFSHPPTAEPDVQVSLHPALGEDSFSACPANLHSG